MAAEWRVSDAVHYAAAVGASFERDRELLDERHGPQLVPTFATFAVGPWLGHLHNTVYARLGPILNGGFEYFAHRAIPAVGVATTWVRIVGVERKPSMTLLWHDTETTDERGDALVSGRHVLLWRTPNDAATTYGEHGFQHRPDRDVAASPSATATVAIDPRAVELYRPFLPLSAGGPPPDPVHVDDDVARAAGLPRAPLHATSVVGHVGVGIARALGAPSRRTVTGFGGSLRAPLFPGDTLDIGLVTTADPRVAVVEATSPSRVLGDAWVAFEEPWR